MTHKLPLGPAWSCWLWQEKGGSREKGCVYVCMCVCSCVCVWRGVCVCGEGGRGAVELLVPRLHHRTVIPFTAEQSRAGTVAALLDFF